MSRYLPSLAVILVGFPIGSAAPRTKDRTQPAGFHPTTTGATWIYLDGGTVEQTFVVTQVKATDEGTLVDVGHTADGKVSPCQQMLISDKGVFRLSVGGGKFTTPECLLKLPHKDGQSWEFELNPGLGVSKLKAVRREHIEVPAGKFDAIRVEREGDGAATYWFAEGIGLVKVTYSGGDRVLKSFAAGEK